jgi:hypothetical protein
MAQGRVGTRTVTINYADNVRFIGGIAVWGNGQGDVSFENGECEISEGDYKKSLRHGTITTPKGVQVTVS